MSNLYESIPPKQRVAYEQRAAEIANEVVVQVAEDLGRQVVAGSEVVLQQNTVDAEAERFLEASYAATWAKSFEETDGEILPYPGLTPLSLRMTKAIGDEERAAVVQQYIQQPESIQWPSGIYTGEN